MSRMHARETTAGAPAENSGATETTCPVKGCNVELNVAKIPNHLAEHGGNHD